MADSINKTGALRDAVIGDRTAWKHWEGGCIGGITYPSCLRKGNTLRIPWQSGDPIDPMEPLLLFRYVSREGKSYLELRLDDSGIPRLY